MIFADLNNFAALILIVASVAIIRIGLHIPPLWRLKFDNSHAALAERNQRMFTCMKLCANACATMLGYIERIPATFAPLPMPGRVPH